jgi:hypothetical protein
MHPYVPPAFESEAFNCPFCSAYARQLWYPLHYYQNGNRPTNLAISQCSHCKRNGIWHDGKLLFPESSPVQNANLDLTDEIIQDYNEAKSIIDKSPRGAAALLRLALQKLMIDLGEAGENINKDIASLVSKGLPVPIQKALDIVRVVGNEAVHPGTIDLKDDRDTAIKLFGLINLIAEDRITRPKQIDEFYSSLPPEKLKAIEERDK